MKKTMMMMTCTAAAVGLFAAPAKPTLVATAELAPFAELNPAVTALGAMMNNPLLPAIAMGGAQQALAQSYGRLRASSPLFLQVYVDESVTQNPKIGEGDPFKDQGDIAVVYPIDETEAAFLQKRNATKAKDGTIMLPKSAKRPQKMCAKYSADGKFCAFAQTPVVATKAIEDFANRPAPKAGARSHVIRVNLNEAGLGTIAAVLQQTQAKQRESLLGVDTKDNRQLAEKFAAYSEQSSQAQLKILKSFSGAMLALDLDDYGIAISGGLRRKPGLTVPEAGAALPAGALDRIPAGAGLFAACSRLVRMAGECQDAAEYAKLRGALVELLKSVPAAVAKEAAKNPDLKQYQGLIDEAIASVSELVLAIAYPQPSDWDSLAIGFDAQQHPALVGGGQVATATAESAAARKFLDRILAAVQRQWPDQKFFVKSANGAYAINWAALIDFVAAQSKEKADPKGIAEVKKYVQAILGGTTTELCIAADGQQATLAAPGVKLAAATTGEARFAAAVPEVAKARPAGVFYFTPYAFARDVVMPVMAKVAGPEEAQQAKAMQAALPAASEKGALAGASWVRKDGSVKFLLRLTADEVKSLGAAVGAFSAGEQSDDDDE